MDDVSLRLKPGFGPVMGASAIVGPILAGFIISANIGGLTWRPIFLINIVLGTAGFIAALRVLPRDEPPSRSSSTASAPACSARACSG